MDQMSTGAAATLRDPRVRRRLGDLLWPPQPRRAVAGIRSLPWLLGRGPSLGVLPHLHARWRPDRVALHDRHGSLTWAELDQRVNRLAAVMEASPQLPPGAKVAVLLRNGREWVEAILAAQKVGRVVLPINTWGRAGEVGAILEREQPGMIIYDVRHAEALEEVEQGPRLVAVGEPAEGVASSEDYERLLAAAEPRPPAPFTRERGSTRIILQTSGTTGTPKGAVRETGGGETAALLGVLSMVPFDEDDVVLVPAPLFHAFGLLTFSLTLLVGATTVLPDGFDAAETFGLVERHRATGLAAVPVMLRRMLQTDDPAAEQADLSSLRALLASGDAMPPELRADIAERFGPVLHDLYGSTEAGWVAVATPDVLADRPDSAGRTVPGVEVRVLDEDDREVPAREHGEIHVTSAARFKGYTHESSSDDGAVATGDLGYLDEDGLVYVAGRADDMVIIGGENVYPVEVEAVIDQIDAVEDAAVIGVDDEDLGQVLAAFVTGEVDPDQVRDRCKDQLASFKVPRQVEVLDALPRTTTGKLRRGELADHLEG
jgi:acyl-CoA synthetase (AMP-forming)/AMP-acid ligase II